MKQLSTNAITKILLIQLGDIGDVVLTAPTIRAVKEKYPDADLSILVRAPFGGVLVADPHLCQIVEFKKSSTSSMSSIIAYLQFALTLWSSRYDLVIDLRTGDRGAIFTGMTGAPQRVGRHVPGRWWHDKIYTTVLTNTPARDGFHPGADQSLQIIRAIGIDTQNSDPMLRVLGRDLDAIMDCIGSTVAVKDKKWISISPFSRWDYKEWRDENWGQVVDAVWQKYQLPAVIVGGEEDRARAGLITAGREEYVVNLAGRTTLGELVALISQSTVHLGVDSAAPHIAFAVDTPTVTIHGPSDWKSWRRVNENHTIVCNHMPCVPCNNKGCVNLEISDCLQGLDVSYVLNAVDKQLTRSRLNTSSN